MRRRCSIALAALLLLIGTACVSKPRWVAEWSPTELAVAAALADSSDDDVYSKGFPIPRPNSRRITQDDFPEIIDAIKVENRDEFGAEAGQPQGGVGGNP